MIRRANGPTDNQLGMVRHKQARINIMLTTCGGSSRIVKPVDEKKPIAAKLPQIHPTCAPLDA
jgi:hypothetical protein